MYHINEVFPPPHPKPQIEKGRESNLEFRQCKRDMLVTQNKSKKPNQQTKLFFINWITCFVTVGSSSINQGTAYNTTNITKSHTLIVVISANGALPKARLNGLLLCIRSSCYGRNFLLWTINNVKIQVVSSVKKHLVAITSNLTSNNHSSKTEKLHGNHVAELNRYQCETNTKPEEIQVKESIIVVKNNNKIK